MLMCINETIGTGCNISSSSTRTTTRCKQLAFLGHNDTSSRNMKSFAIFFALLFLTRIGKVRSAGQFFQVKMGDHPITMDELFLTTDVFGCERETSCTTLLRNSKSNGEDSDSKNAVISISKTNDPSAKYPSCITAMRANDDKEGYYNIHHGKKLHPIEVECKTIDGTTYAIIHHDSEKTELVQGYEAPGSFRRQIKYDIDLGDVKMFVDASEFCSQLTRLDCYESGIHIYGKIYSYIVDRSSLPMAYIGGGPSNDKGCECGMTNQCVTSGLLCNCDKNDEVWRYDSGFVTEKERLPLTEIRVGDTGNRNERMRYTIGPLRCQSEA